MATAVSSEPCRPARPRRWRRVFQFSLRTLLILTTLAAVGCWWYLQPKIQVEELAGGALQLRQQVRPRGKNEFVYNTSTRSVNVVGVGAWQLRDRQNEPLATGRYVEGQPHGWWRVYYPNGRRATEGRMFRGLRVEVWKTWDEQGRRQSQVTYAIRPPPPPPTRIVWPVQRLRRQTGGFGCTTTIPVVGALAPLTGGPTFPAILAGMPVGAFAASANSRLISERHGPAKRWHASGKFKEIGNYAKNRRQGIWIFYDEQGGILATGEYRDGLREGAWQIHGGNGLLETIEFVGDRPRAEYERILSELREELSSGMRERQVVAMDQIESLARHGLPLLIASLSDPSNDLKLLAVRRLERLAIDEPSAIRDAGAEKRLEALADTDDERVARLATLLLYETCTERRDQWFSRLIQTVRRSSDRDWCLEALFAAWDLDLERRPEIFGEIAHGSHHPQQAAMYFQQSDELTRIIDEASQSADTKARRLAIEVVVALTARGHAEFVKLPSGGQELRFSVPDSLQPVVERATSDTDAAVREAASAVGKWPGPRGPAPGGSIGMWLSWPPGISNAPGYF